MNRPQKGPPRKAREDCGDRAELLPREVEVIVLGGGPAGTSAALALARIGRSVVVLEKSCYESARVGEILPPEARLPLAALGVWERFLDGGHMPSPGIVSAWGRPGLVEDDFIVNPHGCGWHVDRRRFDSMLAGAVTEAGATIMESARLISASRVPRGGWRVEALVRGKPVCLRAQVLVDATGRPAALARRLGIRRIVHDRLVGIVVFCPEAAPGQGDERRMLVEAVEDGWWYAAPLPDGRQVAAFMTDAGMLPKRGGDLASFWRDQLCQAPHTHSRVDEPNVEAGPRVVAANSSCLGRAAGAGWLAVGDAAAALDPLSSQGVYQALIGGLEAARAIDDHLRSQQGSFDDYADRAEAEFQVYLQARSRYYSSELRWPDSPFWRRRHAPRSAGDRSTRESSI